jgi:uncharacterized membrane protein HdeD (DUF308 family)
MEKNRNTFGMLAWIPLILFLAERTSTEAVMALGVLWTLAGGFEILRVTSSRFNDWDKYPWFTLAHTGLILLSTLVVGFTLLVTALLEIYSPGSTFMAPGAKL